MTASDDLTLWLDRASQGDAEAHRHLLDRLYDELHELARHAMARESPGSSIQATMLVHDAWLSLMGPESTPQKFERRAHFFGAASRAMRRLLVDHARKRQARKRGGDRVRISLHDLVEGTEADDDHVLALHRALGALESVSREAARVVELRYFTGLTIEEVATVLGRSPATVKREWTYARAWLHERMQRETGS